MGIPGKLAALGAVVMVTGCSELPFITGARADEKGAASVVQVLDVTTGVEGGVGHFAITSTLRNTGTEPATVQVRSCHLRDADLRGQRAGLAIAEPLVLCATEAHSLTLLPGESSPSLALSGQGAPGAVHALELRHMMEPERWEAVTLRIQ